jgi:hypothetical protein
LILTGEEPDPALIVEVPIRLFAGQLADLASADPARPAAAAILPSGQYGTPASFPTRPGGSVMSTPFTSCWPSVREMWTVNGLKAPALVLSEWVEKPGLKGRSAIDFGQRPPAPPAPSVNACVAVAVPFSEYGSRLASD